jgi:hypothetical protein
VFPRRHSAPTAAHDAQPGIFNSRRLKAAQSSRTHDPR